MKPTRTRPRSRLSWKPTFSSSATRDSNGIYAERVFAQIAHYEKLRADRHGSALSLIAFGASPKVSNASTASVLTDSQTTSLINVLRRRVRATDAIGWLDARRIAVLLPATDSGGACALVAAVRAELPALCGLVEVMAQPSLDRTATPPAPQSEPRPDGCDDGGPQALNLEQVLVQPIPVWKRALDIFGAGAGLLLLAPLFGLVALYIRIVSPGPVFFTQPRVGRGGREFNFIKFRSMHTHIDQDLHQHHAADFIRSNGDMQKLDDDDPRIFAGGKLLRVSCIDELPQLWNVLRGEMSLVGPRPCIPYEAAEYQRWHRHRFSMLPGMSGLWQVSGKNKLTFAEMIRLDIRYEKKMSLWLDLLIILRTGPAIVVMMAEAVGRRLARLHSVGGTHASCRGEGG